MHFCALVIVPFKKENLQKSETLYLFYSAILVRHYIYKKREKFLQITKLKSVYFCAMLMQIRKPIQTFAICGECGV